MCLNHCCIHGQFFKNVMALFFTICIRRIWETSAAEIGNQAVQPLFPKHFNLSFLSPYFYKNRTNCIINFYENTSSPIPSENIIPKSAQCPYLRAIIRAIYASGDITAVFLFYPRGGYLGGRHCFYWLNGLIFFHKVVDPFYWQGSKRFGNPLFDVFLIYSIRGP